MNKKVLIFGSGSIAQRHYLILKNKIDEVSQIKIFTKRKLKKYSTINSHYDIIKYCPDYFIIATKTSEHLNNLKFIEKNFQNKLILVEKPLFSKYKKIYTSNNSIFVGYNFRFHPIIQNIKKYIKRKKILSSDIICNSYLPHWRNSIDYNKSSSSSKKFGGGVLLDLSHELDYAVIFFGKLKIIKSTNKKISNLNINTDDYLHLHAISSKKTYVNINLNYFSKISTRLILINGQNFTIKADLIKNKMTIFDKKIKYFQFNIDRNYTYIKQHKAILNNKFEHVCNFSNGIEIMKLIEKVKNK